ncbi:type 1 fimbrial protein [Xenorhabdus sp. 18]|uniref:fimbrial protein n=1 Tax=Xenorhabdus doucetiae TaxID=351671 RepID=UPI0019C26873|nr:fimbrial protein [Xenorhabdus sp. 18]MBD2796276.1 type 1 fimbrial protein [Xenorhabdus sp. 18]
MKLLIKSMTIVAIWGVMAVSAFAMNNIGNIKFSGKVTKGTCSAAVAGEGGNVTMVDVGVGDFASKNDTKGDTPFKIKLSNCKSSDDSSVKVSFMGNKDSGNDTVLANTASSSSAKGVGIGIYKESGVQIPIGSTPVVVDTLTSRDTTKELKFIAKYVATTEIAGIQSGLVQANASFTVEYD